MRVPLTTSALSPIFRRTTPATYAIRTEVKVYHRGVDLEADAPVDVFATEVGGTPLAQPLRTDDGGRIEGQNGEECWVEEADLPVDLVIEGTVIPWNPGARTFAGLEDTDPDAETPGAVVRGSGPRSVVPMVLRDQWWAGDFGAKFAGDDETETLQTALSECHTAKRALHLPEGRAGISETLATNGAEATVVRGAGKELTVLEHGVPGNNLFEPTGPSITPGEGLDTTVIATLTEPAALGATTITVDSTTGIAPGDYLLLKDSAYDLYGNTIKELVGKGGQGIRANKVLSPTSVELAGRLDWALGAGTTTIRKLVTANAAFADLTILNAEPGKNTAAARGIFTQAIRDLHLERVRFELLDGPAAYLRSTPGWRAIDCDFIDLSEDEPNGYGLVVGPMTTAGQMRGCFGRGGRHLITSTQDDGEIIPQHALTSDCLVTEHAYAAFDNHYGSRFFTYVNCKVMNQRKGSEPGGSIGFQMRGEDHRVINPDVSGTEQGVTFNSATRGVLDGGRLLDVKTGVTLNNAEDFTLKGGTTIKASETPVLVKTPHASWAGAVTKMSLDDFTVKGDPSGYAIDFEAALAGAKIGSRFRAPEASRRFRNVGIGSIEPESPYVTTSVIKTADEVVNNSETMQDDDHLQFAIGANEKWLVEVLLNVAGVSQNADFKVGWAYPAGASHKWQGNNNWSSTAVGAAPNALGTATQSAGLGNSEIALLFRGWVQAGATAGIVKFQWAQNTKTAEDVTVKAGSMLRLRRVA